MATSYLDEEGLRLLVQKIQAMPDGATLEYTGGQLKVKDELIPSDKIIAQGTSGEWSYQKYDSGIAKCTCKHRFNSVKWSDMLRGVYCSLGEIDYPFPFVESPSVIMADGSGKNAYYSDYSAGSVNHVTVGICAASTGEWIGTGAVLVNIEVTGKWK